jgi:hypothetical protein
MQAPVLAGDIKGLNRVYDARGSLLGLPGEEPQHAVRNADLLAKSPWRRFLPGVLLLPYPGEADSVLHITNQRIVFLRNIDIRKETQHLMTEMGMFVAMEKSVKLRAVVLAGGMQWCEIYPARLRLVKAIRKTDYADFRLIGDDGKQYAISFWVKAGWNNGILPLIEGRFGR